MLSRSTRACTSPAAGSQSCEVLVPAGDGARDASAQIGLLAPASSGPSGLAPSGRGGSSTKQPPGAALRAGAGDRRGGGRRRPRRPRGADSPCSATERKENRSPMSTSASRRSGPRAPRDGARARCAVLTACKSSRSPWSRSTTTSLGPRAVRTPTRRHRRLRGAHSRRLPAPPEPARERIRPSGPAFPHRLPTDPARPRDQSRAHRDPAPAHAPSAPVGFRPFHPRRPPAPDRRPCRGWAGPLPAHSVRLRRPRPLRRHSLRLVHSLGLGREDTHAPTRHRSPVLRGRSHAPMSDARILLLHQRRAARTSAAPASADSRREHEEAGGFIPASESSRGRRRARAAVRRGASGR